MSPPPPEAKFPQYIITDILMKTDTGPEGWCYLEDVSYFKILTVHRERFNSIPDFVRTQTWDKITWNHQTLRLNNTTKPILKSKINYKIIEFIKVKRPWSSKLATCMNFSPGML